MAKKKADPDDGPNYEDDDEDARSLEFATRQVYDLMTLHRRVGAQCKCGWTKQPMLDMDHRRHVAEKITVGVLLAISQAVGEEVARARNDLLIHQRQSNTDQPGQ